MKLSSKHTIAAGYIGYATQALAINFTPLLFITFENSYNISLGKIGLLIAISFLTQLTVDAIAAKFSSHVNIRRTVVLGHVCAAVGVIMLSFLPDIMPDAFIGLMIPTMLTAIGGGIIEVFISPIVEACPTKEKSAAMSLLHSFYSWGSAATILLSTLFFYFVGINNWRILAVIWAILPLCGAIMFSFVPIYSLNSQETETTTGERKNLFCSGLFWMMFAVMFCAGASEMAMSQWASSFAETALGVDKSIGDLLGPCAFAIFMGLTRVCYAFFSKKIKLPVFFAISAVFCALAYLITALSPIPLISLLGCAICGFSVGIMWPGTYSLATQRIPWGGVRMFAMLALAGDLGCTVGPSMTGFIAEILNDNLKISFLFATVFPITILILIPFIMLSKKKKQKELENGNQ